mgnify:CR=1 FL=1
MEEKKIKKKKLTLSVSSKILHNVPNYVKSRKKTSVLIEKKTPRRWGEKKFQSRDHNFNKPKSSSPFMSTCVAISFVDEFLKRGT